MAKTDPALIPGAATGELAHGSLRLVDAIAIWISVIAPGMAMLLNVTGVRSTSPRGCRSSSASSPSRSS